MNRGLALGIEISNPPSGPRGHIDPEDPDLVAGPGVALGTFDPPHSVQMIGSEPLSETGRHDDDLMPAIDRLCRRADVTPKDLKLVAVSIGPGGYTSLRIAVATAKMIAEATGALTIAVHSAAVAAWNAPPDAPALVCMASKGNTAWCELLPPSQEDPWWNSTRHALAQHLSPEALQRLKANRDAGRSWIAAREPIGIADAAALEALVPRMIIADHFLPPEMQNAARQLGAAIVEPTFAAQSVLQIAIALDPVDPLALSPLYPREPDAVTQWRKRAGA